MMVAGAVFLSNITTLCCHYIFSGHTLVSQFANPVFRDQSERAVNDY